MKMNKLVLPLVAIICVAVIGFFILQDTDNESEPSFDLFFPKLVDQIEEVTQISVSTSREKLTIRLIDDEWRLENKDFYPVRFEPVQKLLVGLSQLRKLERKTSDPDRYGELNLAGVGIDGSSTILVELRNSGGGLISSVNIGKSQASMKRPELIEFYVRATEDSQTWLVEGYLEVPSSALGWLDPTIVDIDEERIKRVMIETRPEKLFGVSRRSASSKDFEIFAMPAYSKVRHQYKVNDIGDFFGRLNFYDVKSREFPIREQRALVAVTFDGLRISVLTRKNEDDGFVSFEVSADDDAEDNVKQEAAILAQKFDDWRYKLSEQRMEMINTTLDQLIE